MRIKTRIRNVFLFALLLVVALVIIACGGRVNNLKSNSNTTATGAPRIQVPTRGGGLSPRPTQDSLDDSNSISSTSPTTQDSGALHPTEAPSPLEADGATNIVLKNSFDQCSPIVNQYILVECKDGQLAFTRKATGGPHPIYYPPVLQDAVIEVTARLPSQKNAFYGVVFRMDETGNNYYLFSVSNDGRYGLARFAGDQVKTILPFTKSVNVGSAGYPTKIKIVNQGDVIAINLGGEWIDSVRDSNLTSGRVGLYVGPQEPNPTVLFDDFRVAQILSPLPVPEARVVEPSATRAAEDPNYFPDCVYVESYGDIVCPHDNH